MLGRSFKIIGPKRFETYVELIDPELNEAVVKITKAAICKADIRYYLGARDRKLLDLKYPLSLIHEACGYITKDPSNTFKLGQRVVLVPNITGVECCQRECSNRVCENRHLGENYCPLALFASSNCDGFSRSFISYPVRNLIKVPDNIDDYAAVFCELISVASSAARRIELEKKDRVAIWGDGILSYILYNYIKTVYNYDVIVIGKHTDKLKCFESCVYVLADEAKRIKDMKIKVAFECVGGKGCEDAINQIINCVEPGGRIILTGVSENNVCLNTRRILEKGLSIYGVTRSNIADFKHSLLALNDEEFSKNIKRLILNKITISNIMEYHAAFEFEVNNRDLGKNVLEYNF